jgi:hypothetical protein
MGYLTDLICINDAKINASPLAQISLRLEASKPSVSAFIGSSPVTKDCSFIKEFRASFWRAAGVTDIYKVIHYWL